MLWDIRKWKYNGKTKEQSTLGAHGGESTAECVGEVNCTIKQEDQGTSPRQNDNGAKNWRKIKEAGTEVSAGMAFQGSGRARVNGPKYSVSGV